MLTIAPNSPSLWFALLELLLVALGVFLVYRLLLAGKIYRSKRHLESAFDSIEDPLAIVNRGFVLLRVNRAYCQLVEKSFPEVLGRHCYAILRGRDTPCEDCKLKEVLHTERKKYTPRSGHPRAPHRRTISFTFYPFQTKRGSESSVVEHIRDITELEYLKENLEKRNRDLSDTTIVLQRAQAEMKDELALARQVQRSTLPQGAPIVDGLKIDVTYHPIEAVGGDVYDFIPFSDSKTAIFVGDASGHGLPSAFVSTISKMSLYNNTRAEIAPAKLLDRMNHDLLGNIRTTHYLTSVCAVFDTSENSITYARAGHPMPIVIRNTGEVFHLGAIGTFIGILESAAYEQRKFLLRKGDRCYFCTDGIYEVMENGDSASGVLGFKAFSDIVASVNQLPFQDIIPALRDRLARYTYEDDYTLIVVEITEDRPFDIAESLPGFRPNDDLSFISFSAYSEMSNQLEALLAAMAKLAYDERDRKAVRLCINELVVNALEHGNGNADGRRVTLAYTADHDAVRFCVVDEGNGFDMGSLPDPTMADNLNKEGGRGLYLVRQFADEVGQNARGNGVFVVKNKGRAA
ncbi:MAG: SpoIIE family protein phosphatase [Chitinivibrionales bacterium]|nr:SpoIIE family protein phosphatase [Chitinivibrionales bacterium]MBD3396812.1 SpoIIE family protein phosphatase [Chitinivibrionales bacterium]